MHDLLNLCQLPTLWGHFSQQPLDFMNTMIGITCWKEPATWNHFSSVHYCAQWLCVFSSSRLLHEEVGLAILRMFGKWHHSNLHLHMQSRPASIWHGVTLVQEPVLIESKQLEDHRELFIFQPYILIASMQPEKHFFLWKNSFNTVTRLILSDMTKRN